MYGATLQTIAQAKGLNQSDMARLAGCTRQAVSVWFKTADTTAINIHSHHLFALCKGLGVTPQTLSRPLPGLTRWRERWQATYLWDQIYPSVEAFALALSRGEHRALARLVDRAGIFAAAKIAGSVVWDTFAAYERLLRPQRRHELRRLWELQLSLGLI